MSCGCFKAEERAKRYGNRHPRWKGGKHKQYGYVVLSNASYPGARPFSKTAEHVIVMARYLGRPLRSGESAHHKNGVRDDNRIENLELWSTPHPSGQRVEDLIMWAGQLLANYAPEMLAQPPVALDLSFLVKTTASSVESYARGGRVATAIEQLV